MSVSSLTATGASSQIDQLVAEYTQQQSGPITKLQTKKDTLSTRESTYNTIKTKLQALQTEVEQMAGTTDSTSISSLAVQNVDSSDTDVLTATADGTAVNTTHSILVTQLAKSDTVLSSRLLQSGTDIVTATGVGTKEFTIGTTKIDVNIANGDTNDAILKKIAVQINDKDFGVSASVVADTATTDKLILTANSSGSANALALSETGVGNTLLQSMGLTSDVLTNRTTASSTKAGYIYSDMSTLDAKLKVDNIDIVRSSNKITDVLSGVTLNLKTTQADTDTPVTVGVSTNTDSVKTEINNFMNSYNDVMTFLNGQIQTTGTDRGPMAGDTMVTNLRSSMKMIFLKRISSVQTGNPSLMADIGITFDKDGTLSITNETTLDDALDADPRKVTNIFNSKNGIAQQFDSLLKPFTKSGGQFDSANNLINMQISDIASSITQKQNQISKQGDALRQQYSAMVTQANNLQAQMTMITKLFAS